MPVCKHHGCKDEAEAEILTADGWRPRCEHHANMAFFWGLDVRAAEVQD